MRTALVIVFVLLFPTLSLADVMHLDDGSVLHGRVVSRTDTVVVFEMSGGTIEVPRGRIRNIEYGTAAPIPSPAVTPAGSSAQPTVWDAASPQPAATAATKRPGKKIGLQGRLGVHAYGGSGWSAFEEYRDDFTSAALEGGTSIRIEEQRDMALDLVLSAGFYGGSACIPDSDTTCATVSLFNAYFDAGPRLEIFAGPFGVYGQVGAGIYSSSVYIESPALGDDSNSRSSLSAHLLGGLALEVDRSFRLFGEMKWISADGRFPGATANWDMGGLTIFLGAELRL